MNTVTIIARLGNEPEIRFSADQTAVVRCRVAIDNPRKPDNPDWVSVVAFGKIGESLAQWKHKGDEIAVAGRLSSRQWETPEGEKRSTVEIVANQIDYLRRNGNSKAADNAEAAAVTEEEEPF